MQHVNDDMDELFKSAGENYPLNTSHPNWDKVYTALQEGSEARAVAQDSKRKYLWLLCLLPLGFVCNRYFFAREKQPDNSKKITQNVAKPSTHAIVSNNNAGNNYVSSLSKSELPASKDQAPATSRVDINTQYSKGTLSVVSHRIKALNRLSNKPERKLTNPIRKIGRKDNNSTKISSDVAEAKETALNEYFRERVLSGALAKQTITLTALSAGHTSIVPEISQPSISTPRFRNRFYGGIIGGGDLTTVRFQKSERLGSHVGGLVGYQLSRKWSVEAGVLIDKKYYYTQGKYFDSHGLYLAAGTKITELSGNCRMLELPIALRYNFSSSEYRTWFVTAGASSYIMKKENYSYLYYYGSSGTSALHDKSYNNSSAHLFAVMHLSGGYTKRLAGKTSLRLEPYVELPVAGVGFGNLRLTSLGMNVGIIRKF